MAVDGFRRAHRIIHALAYLLALMLVSTHSARAQSERLSLLTWGGVYLQHLQASSLLGYANRNGVTLSIVDYPRQVLPRQLLDSRAATDLAVVEQVDAREGCEQAWLQPLALLSLPPAPDGAPALRDFIDDSLETCAVPLLQWAQVPLYAPSLSVPPAKVADFFDLERFPGKRVLTPSPVGLLELALLGDQVGAGAVYPTLSEADGLARALRRLQGLSGEVLWVTDGHALIETLERGEAVMGFSNTLDWHNSAAGRSALGVIWDGEILHTDMLVIPSVNRQPQRAWELLQRMTATDAQALLAQLGGYAPVRRSALARLSLELQARLPGQPRSQIHQLEFDGRWWRSNGDAVAARFERWLAKQDWSLPHAVR